MLVIFLSGRVPARIRISGYTSSSFGQVKDVQVARLCVYVHGALEVLVDLKQVFQYDELLKKFWGCWNR